MAAMCAGVVPQQPPTMSGAPADIWAEIRAVQKQQQSALVLANESSSPSFNLFEEAPSKAAIAAAPGAADISELDAAVKRAGFSTFWEDEEDVVVGLEDIAAVASIWSGVPVQQLTTEESARLVDLENTLRTRVIGQVGVRCPLAWCQQNRGSLRSGPSRDTRRCALSRRFCIEPER